MFNHSIKVTPDGVSLYDSDGSKRAELSKSRTSFDSVSFDAGVGDAGRIGYRAHAMNPMSALVPSDAVTPVKLWMEIPPVYIVGSILYEILKVLSEFRDLERENAPVSRLGKPKKITTFQIINFNDFLPERVTDG